MEMKKILILGHTGMLGHMVVKYLSDKCICNTILYRFPSNEFKQYILDFDGDCIINCIGAIPQRKKEFQVNFDLPVWLSDNAKCKIIHPSTDCEIDDNEYGISKRKAAEYIKNNSKNTKIIKTSIIGPELNGRSSLLSWFMHSTGEVKGYKNAYWNGITTLEWAKLCYNLINWWDDFEIENVAQSECISKYELLCIFKDVYKKDIIISPFENDLIDKCLNGTIITKNIREQLIELKSYYESN